MKPPIKRGRLMAEINITPFTDVVLVLLIIFMITTPLFVQSSINIKLPKSTTAESEMDKNIIITITEKGEILLNNTPKPLDDIEREITARLTGNPNIAVVVRADKLVVYQEVIKVLDILRHAGVKRLALAVEKEQSEQKNR